MELPPCWSPATTSLATPTLPVLRIPSAHGIQLESNKFAARALVARTADPTRTVCVASASLLPRRHIRAPREPLGPTPMAPLSSARQTEIARMGCVKCKGILRLPLLLCLIKEGCVALARLVALHAHVTRPANVANVSRPLPPPWCALTDATQSAMPMAASCGATTSLPSLQARVRLNLLANP